MKGRMIRGATIGPPASAAARGAATEPFRNALEKVHQRVSQRVSQRSRPHGLGVGLGGCIRIRACARVPRANHHMGVRVFMWVYEFVGVVYEFLAPNDGALGGCTSFWRQMTGPLVGVRVFGAK